jgi:DMSO/TMAO reductase YedYZ molybdopterin-dependent catalytic subunit
MGLTRRRFLRDCLAASVAAGCGGRASLARDTGFLPDAPAACDDPFAGGQLVETLKLHDASDPTSGLLVGAGLDARLFTDLAPVGPDQPVTPVEQYYVRTAAPDGLGGQEPWRITIGGRAVSVAELGAPADQGTFVMECSGNTTQDGFELMSAGAWSGVAVADVLVGIAPPAGATQVLVEGYDRHDAPSTTSDPGASWIFPIGTLEAAGAFLATHLGGVPLTPDHGAPVRLYVPGWYGCACIKWVTRIAFVGDEEPATSQMIEFARRTMQPGVPALARDYQPATIDQAAMATRVERWVVDGRTLFRIAGILWGGARPTDKLQLRIGTGGPLLPVTICPPMTQNRTWTFWSVAWQPPSPGTYELACVIADATVRQRRLDTGWYARRVSISGI